MASAEVSSAKLNNAPNKVIISKRRRITLPQWATAWLVLIPAMIFVCLFMLYPIINTSLYAFMQNFSYTRQTGQFALGQFLAGALKEGKPASTTFGLHNFKEVFASTFNDDGSLNAGSFLSSIINTAILTIFEVPLTIIVSLLIATFLNSIKALKGFYQTIFFLPYVTNTIALGLVFNIAFKNTPGGLVNLLLHDVFGVKDPINFLSAQKYMDYPVADKFHQGIVIVLYSLWNGIAFKILVFMSGLATIDSQYYNAAKIDGASNFTIWRRITLPLLSPQILYITITSFIGAFKMYTGVNAVYSGISSDAFYFGGDGDDWITVVGWIYKYKDTANPTKASAASIILLGIIMLITLVQFAVSKKRVHY